MSNDNKKMTLVLPVHKDFVNNIDDEVCLYPETQRTPKEQVDFMKAWTGRNRNKNNITIVSVSSYVFQSALKMLDDYFTEDEILYSDGEKQISSDDFWKHQAEAMRELYLYQP